MESNGELMPIETMLAIMLDSWNQKYSFDLDRVTRKAIFKRGPVTINAEEKPDGLIFITVLRGDFASTKTASPEEAAKSITTIIVDVMDKELEHYREAERVRKRWWQFWK